MNRQLELLYMIKDQRIRIGMEQCELASLYEALANTGYNMDFIDMSDVQDPDMDTRENLDKQIEDLEDKVGEEK